MSFFFWHNVNREGVNVFIITLKCSGLVCLVVCLFVLIFVVC